MLGDGNGWVVAPSGMKLWGKYGAAGLFLVADGGQAGETGRETGQEGVEKQVLLQHRAKWTAQGGTWGIPGGAIDSHETAAEAAVRETVEECAIDPAQVEVVDTMVTAEFPGWSYTTVLARCDAPLEVQANEESEELRWVELSRVREFDLHPGFAGSLERVMGHTVTHD
ncbi:NUDIX domain-containing protein [Corynebacterium sp. Marseille-P4321]|uniref:NUDIX domain-containing protein n=1 Tax=Corynebacterium sp. Marseille-P4321 TaxID=2736603 RepID=UPI00158F0587|nr:NUDIX hydrolase [Corynebacterium sp. Marseille-P4321]